MHELDRAAAVAASCLTDSVDGRGLCFHHHLPVVGTAGCAVIPWRGRALAASAAGVSSYPTTDEVEPDQQFSWALVVADKDRGATYSACAAAWQRLEVGGNLVVAGHNTVGIRSTVRRVAECLGQEGTVLAQRAHCRVVSFVRVADSTVLWPSDESLSFAIDHAGVSLALQTAPGVFSGGRLDAGSALLLEQLSSLVVTAPQRVVDLGCGCGVLGLAAGQHWPTATMTFADHDARAVGMTEVNARQNGMEDRIVAHWWDAQEPWPSVSQADVMVCNPPFHAGKAVDYTAVHGMFATMRTVLAPQGVAVVVANRQMPYEKILSTWASVVSLVERDGFKVLRVTHHAHRSH